MGISLLMMGVELVAGWWTGSLLLISDGVHMLSHVIALGISLLAFHLAARPCSDQLPFGLYRIEVLAALVNGLGLVCLCFWILHEGIERLFHPVPISSVELLVVAVAGLLVNAITIVLLWRAGVEDLNTRGAWLHLLADGISSIFVVMGGVVLHLSGWRAIDPLLSMMVALFVGKWAWDLIREATTILLERKPVEIDLRRLETRLREVFPDVHQVHDLHVWEITSHYICLSMHCVLDDLRLSETTPLQRQMAFFLRHEFGIGHTVIQFECRTLAPSETERGRLPTLVL